MVFDRFRNSKQDEIFDEYQKQVIKNNEKLSNLNQRIKGQHAMLNNIFIFYDLEPTPFLTAMRQIGYEMLNFMDNVAKKHNLEWWMDYGTLLGAVRHRDFVPWDDDLDCGMMRSDMNVLMDVIQDEIKDNNLEHIVAEYKLDKHSSLKTKRWFQIKLMNPDLYGSICTLDVFPYDYIRDYNGEDIEETYYDCMREWFKYNQHEDMTPHLDKAFDKLNLTLERDDYIISGVESVRGKIKMYPYKIMKTDEIFPLTRMQFGKCNLPAPNQTKEYIKYIYGKKFMAIPRRVRDHDRLERYVKQENIMEILENEISMLKDANDNY